MSEQLEWDEKKLVRNCSVQLEKIEKFRTRMAHLTLKFSLKVFKAGSDCVEV